MVTTELQQVVQVLNEEMGYLALKQDAALEPVIKDMYARDVAAYAEALRLIDRARFKLMVRAVAQVNQQRQEA
jgi:hypothetical protein